jgi:hypothetical protein
MALIDGPPAPAAASAPPSPEPSSLQTSEKVTLLRRLFLGRTDVHPVRWDSATIGKSGYALACANEWRPGICEKPRVKCADSGVLPGAGHAHVGLGQNGRTAILHGESARRARARDGPSDKCPLDLGSRQPRMGRRTGTARVAVGRQCAQQPQPAPAATAAETDDVDAATRGPCRRTSAGQQPAVEFVEKARAVMVVDRVDAR